MEVDAALAAEVAAGSIAALSSSSRHYLDNLSERAGRKSQSQYADLIKSKSVTGGCPGVLVLRRRHGRCQNVFRRVGVLACLAREPLHAAQGRD